MRPNRGTLRTEYLLGLTILLLLATVIIDAMVSYSNLRIIVRNDGWVAHTHEVIAQIRSVHAALTDAETGQRGYLLSGDPTFLASYDSAAPGLSQRIAELRQLTRDNPVQQHNVALLDEQMRHRLRLLQANVELVRTDHADRALLRQRLLDGKQSMDAVRGIVQAMVQEEERLLAMRRRETRARYVQAVAGFGVANVVTVLVLTGGYLSLSGSIRKQRIAATALRNSERRLYVTLQSIGDAMIATDAEGRVTMLNPVAEAMTGWTATEASGRPSAEVFHIINEQTRERVESPVDRVLATGGIVGLANHTVLIARDGTERPIDDSGAPIHDEQGRIIGTILVFRDVTERRAAETALRERTHELETLMRTMPAALWIAHDAECTRLTGNPAANRVLRLPQGHTGPAKVGTTASYKAYLDGKPMGPEDSVLRRAVRSRGQIVNQDVTIEFPDGSRTELLGNAAPLFNADGEVRGAVATFLDISLRKNQERELARVNLRLQRMMAETHHRVKNNLQVISALIDMQVMKYETDANVPISEMRRLGQHIRGLAIVHDLLTAGAKTDPHQNDISVSEAMEKLHVLLEPVTTGRRFTMEVQEARLPVRHSAALAVLVNELVSNAIKHGGPNIHLTFATSEAGGRLCVEDDGAGFPPGFDPATAANTGLELIESVGRWDLRGEVTYGQASLGGAAVIVEFPIPQAADERGNGV